MIINGTEDLRVQKTVSEIKRAFNRLLIDKRAEDISVKQLCEEARINKKTFYSYYKSINELLVEIQLEYALDFLSGGKTYEISQDVPHAIAEFFCYADTKGEDFDRVMIESAETNPEPINAMIKARLDLGSGFEKLPAHEQNLVLDYIVNTVLNVCKRWILNGKSMPLKRVTDLTVGLVMNGLSGIVG